MEPWIQTIITITCTLLASSGFWAYIQKRGDASNAEKRLLIGLAHDQYENLHDYLFIPYSEAGGNGSAAKVMKDVDNLPVHKTGYKSKER